MNFIDATGEAFRLLLSGDAELWRIIFISLRVSILGLLLALLPGVIAGYLLAMWRFPGRRALSMPGWSRNHPGQRRVG